MGIYCEINLFKPSDYVYRPGQVVSGAIKYTVDEPTEVDKIIVSLKGIGRLVLTKNPGKKQTVFRGQEDYIDIDTIIQDEPIELAVGLYEMRFNYNLPTTLPASMKLFTHFPGYRVKCFIKYYIRIKFERPGFFVFDNHFRKEIIVKTEVAPRMLREPIIYGETKKLFHLFSFEDSIVNIKATILNSALPCGGKIEVHYEVQNKSHVIVRSIITKLAEAYTFKARGWRKVPYEQDIPGTERRTSCINCDETRNMSIVMDAPLHVFSLDNSEIVQRDFVIKIIADLPLPHRNAVVTIPLQIGISDHVDQIGFEHLNEDVMNDEPPPPTYWEAMGGSKKENDDSSDDESHAK